MYNQNQFLANNAKTALENHRREQEERKIAMIREQKTRELQQLETQLFYKKSEVERLKALANRLRREAVVRQNTELKEEHELQVQDHNLNSLPIRLIREFVDEFIAYATMNSELSFRITDIGGGLLGFKPEQIAPLFKNAPMNCQFTTTFKKILKRV